MILPDVNLLLYAVVSGFPEHAAARSWWEETLNGTAEVSLASAAMFGFLRVGTNPRVLREPLSVEKAVGYLNDWLSLPNVSFLQPGPRHLSIAFDLLREVGTAGNLTTDAQLAALAIEHNAEVYSNDSDFGRFRVVRWINPLR